MESCKSLFDLLKLDEQMAVLKKRDVMKKRRKMEDTLLKRMGEFKQLCDCCGFIIIRGKKEMTENSLSSTANQ